MTQVERLARFVESASYDALSDNARFQLKARVLDSIGCAIGALGADLVQNVREFVDEFDGKGDCTLIGGGKAASDRAVFFNSALVRYLDFNDSYFAPGETCHPSDNLAAILAAAEIARLPGRELICALAVAYQVQCRLSDEAPVRAHGFDHTTQGAYAAAAGLAKALRLSANQTANGIAISGTANNALRVTRTGRLSQWKGLAYAHVASNATRAVLLARRGITGPLEVFEGNKGFMDSIAGKFEIDWPQENLERVTRSCLKKFNAEVHSQSAIEGILELRRRHQIAANNVLHVEVDIFQAAYDIIGGGEEGNKKEIATKEQADHSLPYILAVALLDGGVMPEQYFPRRICAPDVQGLMHKILIRPLAAHTARFPQWLPCRLVVTLRDGSKFSLDKDDYEGFYTRPMPWESVVDKFDRLSAAQAESQLRREIIGAVEHLESISATELVGLLGRVGGGGHIERKVSR